MELAFKHSIGDKVVYTSANIKGTVVGLYQYKKEPSQALMEYVDSTGSLNTMWRNEVEFELE